MIIKYAVDNKFFYEVPGDVLERLYHKLNKHGFVVGPGEPNLTRYEDHAKMVTIFEQELVFPSFPLDYPLLENGL